MNLADTIRLYGTEYPYSTPKGPQESKPGPKAVVYGPSQRAILGQETGPKALLTPQTRTKDDIANWIFTLTRNTGRTRTTPIEHYKDKWLPSNNFQLMHVPLQKVNQPIRPKYPEVVDRKTKPGQVQDTPIVIDKNQPENGWKGSHLVIDGKHRTEAWGRMGWETGPAWVGDQAVGDFTE